MYQDFLTQFTILEHHLLLPSILPFCLSFHFHMCFLLAVFFLSSLCKIFPHVASLKLLVVGKRRGQCPWPGWPQEPRLAVVSGLACCGLCSLQLRFCATSLAHSCSHGLQASTWESAPVLRVGHCHCQYLVFPVPSLR